MKQYYSVEEKEIEEKRLKDELIHLNYNINSARRRVSEIEFERSGIINEIEHMHIVMAKLTCELRGVPYGTDVRIPLDLPRTLELYSMVEIIDSWGYDKLPIILKLECPAKSNILKDIIIRDGTSICFTRNKKPQFEEHGRMMIYDTSNGWELRDDIDCCNSIYKADIEEHIESIFEDSKKYDYELYIYRE